MTRSRGRVVGQNPDVPSSRPKTQITIELDDHQRIPRMSSTVEVRTVLTDEEIGRRLRRMLTESEGATGPDLKLAVRNLAEEVEDSCGWSILADLIREVRDGE
jgi:hypothetical protein